MASQVTPILYFFLSRNIRIARSRAYAQTIVSRGKGPDFWKPYVEEWDNPPPVKKSALGRFAASSFGRILVKRRCFNKAADQTCHPTPPSIGERGRGQNLDTDTDSQ